ncbi:MAG: hypothetical protein WBD16_08060 [Pyrinomonadaceae bacterium]
MKNDKHINAADNETTEHYPNNSQQGRILLGLLIFFGFALAATIVLYYVVITAQRLDPPKDTEVGIMAVVAAVTLLAILGQILVTVLQWQAMQDALERTDTLLEQNKRIVKAAKRQAAAAKRNLKQTQSFFELVQRPILGIEKMYPTKDTNGNLVVVGELINRGKTVANIISQKVFADVIDSSPEVLRGNVPPPGVPMESPAGVQFIHIGGVRELDFPPLVPTAWDDISNGDGILLVWTEITYKGLTESDPYILEIYSAWNRSNERFHGCPTHNRAT